MPPSIRLRELLPAAHIKLLAENHNKKRTFEQAATLLEELHGSLSRNDLFRQFMERERQGSTSIGFYGAIPHIHSDKIKKPLCLLLHLKKPMQYDADNAPTSAVHTLFFLIVPENAGKLHLQLLAILSHILADEVFMTQLANCTSEEKIHQEITAWEKKNNNTLNELLAQ